MSRTAGTDKELPVAVLETLIVLVVSEGVDPPTMT